MQRASEKEIADRLWRLQNLYLIRDKKRKLRKLKFHPNQERLWAVVERSLREGKPIRDMDLKARQVGASTFWLIYYLDDTLFTPNTVTFIVAQKQETLGLLWDATRLAYNNMPDGVRPVTREDSARTLAFDGLNSTVKVSLSVKSTTLHNLLVSEFALCDPDEIEQTLAAAPPDANITLETVPRGMNHAYDRWIDEKDGYTKTLLPWYRQTEYRLPVLLPVTRNEEEDRFTAKAKRQDEIEIEDSQIIYRRAKRRELKRLYHEQFVEDDVSCFLASGQAFFDGAKLGALIKAAEPKRGRQVSDEWEIWEEPTHKHLYVGGADVAEGNGGDYSVLAIICLTCKRTAARYHAHCGVDSFYRTCNSTGVKYNRALLGIELNNHGHAVVMGLREIGYPNLYKQDHKHRIIKSSRDNVAIKFGWETTADSKPVMLDHLKVALEGDSESDEDNFDPAIEWLDTEFLKEALTIHEQGGKIQAVTGKHDDLVIAYAIAWQMYLREYSRMGTNVLKGIIVGDKLESA